MPVTVRLRKSPSGRAYSRKILIDDLNIGDVLAGVQTTISIPVPGAPIPATAGLLLTTRVSPLGGNITPNGIYLAVFREDATHLSFMVWNQTLGNIGMGADYSFTVDIFS